MWALAAVAIVQDGLTAIQRRADEVLVAEARGRLVNPAWLELCRRRVTEVTGQETVPSGPGTCPGGLAQVRALTETASPCRAGN